MITLLIISAFLLANTNNPVVAPRFQAQTIDDKVAIGYGIALGDVDGDGKPDILLADKKEFVWYRNGDWKRFVMVDQLTEKDNVCIAARDLDGDGKVEVAVGAQWNPGETTDTLQSGAVHYLVRPADPTQRWQPVKLHHEPTTHRMQWVKSSDGNHYLVVLPLHGRVNKNGEGKGVNVMAYQFPANPHGKWNTFMVDTSMHLTHNMTVRQHANRKGGDLLIAGKEGVKQVMNFKPQDKNINAMPIVGVSRPSGELRLGQLGKQEFLATIEPMHGTTLAVYVLGNNPSRIVIDEHLKEGHALATGDFLGIGRDQVIAGWRVPDHQNKVGIKMYVPTSASGEAWETFWIDDNGIATEDLQVIDLDGDGKLEIIAAGRATNNLKIYWNKN